MNLTLLLLLLFLLLLLLLLLLLVLLSLLSFLFSKSQVLQSHIYNRPFTPLTCFNKEINSYIKK